MPAPAPPPEVGAHPGARSAVSATVPAVQSSVDLRESDMETFLV
jgi:hypothetical protein